MSLLTNRRRGVRKKTNPYLMTSETNPEVLAVCYAQGWCASPDYMTYEEAAAVTSVGTIFRNNTQITHFEELEFFGVTNLAQFAFAGCTNLEILNLPSSLQTMGGYCINSTKIQTLVFPDGFQSFSGGYAVQGNSLLSDIVFLSTSSLSLNAGHIFRNCPIISLTIHSTSVPALSSGTFNDISTDFTIYVPSESVAAYKQASRWSNYADKIFAIPS